MIDIHSHILPGVDDGPGDEEGTLALLRRMAADGITEVAATPHMLDGRYDVSRDRMLEGVERVRRLVEEEVPSLTVHPGAEVLVHPDLPDRLARGEVATLSEGGRYILVEMSFQVVPVELGRLLFEIQLKGVVPVLAHPERTRQVQRRPEILDPLVEAGVLMQINASSLTGDLGEAERGAALALVERGVAHIVASDAHDPVSRPSRMKEAQHLLMDLVGQEETDRMVAERPRRILAGEEVVVPMPGKLSGTNARRTGCRNTPIWKRVFSWQ